MVEHRGHNHERSAVVGYLALVPACRGQRAASLYHILRHKFDRTLDRIICFAGSGVTGHSQSLNNRSLQQTINLGAALVFAERNNKRFGGFGGGRGVLFSKG